MMSYRVLPMVAALVGAAVSLAGCGSSPPTRFYTLSVKPAEGAPVAGGGQVVVSGVSLPGELDRPEMVRRTAPNQISISELDRWAAPLEDTVRRVLSDDIARRSSSGVGEPQRLISVDIHEFFGDASCNVTLRAVWTLKQTGAVPGTEEIQVPASGGGCPSGLPEAMSVALGQLSDRIVAGVAKVPPPAASAK
jgi:uncharacterized protein